MKRFSASSHRTSRRGFIFVEVLIGASLVGIGFAIFMGVQSSVGHAAKDARNMTNCTALAESQMEQLRTVQWCAGEPPPAILDDSDGTDQSEVTGMPWEFHSIGKSTSGGSFGSDPVPVNVYGDFLGDAGQPARGSPAYYLSWDALTDPDGTADNHWMRIKVKCQYDFMTAADFSRYRGVQVVGYRLADEC